MRRSAWIVFALVLLLAVLAAMVGAAFLVWELPQEIGTVIIDGKVLDLQGAHVGHWLLATMAVLLAMTVVLVVVPTVLLIVLAVPVALAAFGFGVAALACAVALAPLWLLIRWLWKERGKPRTITP